MARDGQEAVWEKIFPSIFCANEKDPDLKRQPGLLKVRICHLIQNLKKYFRPNSGLLMGVLYAYRQNVTACTVETFTKLSVA